MVQQAPLLDGMALDAFTHEQEGVSLAEINIDRGEVLQALVAALVALAVGSRSPTMLRDQMVRAYTAE